MKAKLLPLSHNRQPTSRYCNVLVGCALLRISISKTSKSLMTNSPNRLSQKSAVCVMPFTLVLCKPLTISPTKGLPKCASVRRIEQRRQWTIQKPEPVPRLPGRASLENPLPGSFLSPSSIMKANGAATFCKRCSLYNRYYQ